MKNILKKISAEQPYKVTKLYELDNVSKLSIGISNSESTYDIVLFNSNEDIQCGLFAKEDEYWFYIDNNTNVKAYYNGKLIKPVWNKLKRPCMLENGDEISFVYKNRLIAKFVYEKRV